MSIDDVDVGAITRTIWRSILSVELEPLAEIPVDGGEVTSTGCILISGAWTGAVMLRCASVAARGFAARMFESTPEAVSADELDDALGELANLVGGCFKNQIGGSCVLSLPTVVHGREHTFRVPHSRLLRRVAFDADGAYLVVSVFERERTEARESCSPAIKTGANPT